MFPYRTLEVYTAWWWTHLINLWLDVFLKARFLLVVLRGFNICWERVVGMTSCATLVLALFDTPEQRNIYIFLPFIENSSFLIKLKWDTLSYVTKGGLWEYLVWCYEETKCNGSSLYTCTYILSRCSFISCSTHGLVWCRFSTSYQSIGYKQRGSYMAMLSISVYW